MGQIRAFSNTTIEYQWVNIYSYFLWLDHRSKFKNDPRASFFIKTDTGRIFIMEEVPSEVGSSGSMTTLILQARRKEEKHSFSKSFRGLLAPDFSDLPTDLGLNKLHF